MRRVQEMRGLAVAAAAISTAVPASAQPTISPPPVAAPAPVTDGVKRAADLLRLWNFVRLFHIDEAAMGPAWERALAEAAGPALAAQDDAALTPVVQRMMAQVQPSDAPVRVQNVAPTAPAWDVAPWRLVDGVPIGSCPSIARAATGGAPVRAPDEIRAIIPRKGLILDCRGFSTGPERQGLGFSFHQWFSTAAPYLVDHAVDRGAMRTRYHDGYPPDSGRTSGGYSRGTSDKSYGRIEPVAAEAALPTKLVFIADATTPEPWALGGGLRSAGAGGMVAQGDLAVPGFYPFATEHLRVGVKTGEYVGADGRMGFRPDACVAASGSEAAMAAARALLTGGRAPACTATSPRSPAPSAASARNASTTAPEAGPGAAPPLGQRMVALAKLWGTIEYFLPYRGLNDQPWTASLDEFLPVFAAATTRAAYEDAVVRLAQRTDDSHTGVMGLREHRLGHLASPPIYVRPVEGRFAVAGLHDPALAASLRIGDEIVAVDGRPVADMVLDLRPLVARSTEQAFARRAASLLLAGEAGSDIRLMIVRGGSAPFEVALKRSVPDGGAMRRPPTQEPSFRRIAPDIGYIDLERLTPQETDRAIDSLMDTSAIIFDLRGYPRGTAWTLAPRLALVGREGATAAQFRRPSYRGPSEAQGNWTSFEQQIPTGTKLRYGGRIIVLIDDRAISQSEHTALFFNAAADPVFVGTPTTGANGDVTSVALPGDLSVVFTGHDVRHADGKQLQRVGIQPDVVVAPTFGGMRAGRDEVLEAGLKEARRRAR